LEDGVNDVAADQLSRPANALDRRMGE